MKITGEVHDESLCLQESRGGGGRHDAGKIHYFLPHYLPIGNGRVCF